MWPSRAAAEHRSRLYFYTPLAYKMQGMEFIETPTFTALTQLLTDDEYREMQNVLVEDPSGGDIIKAVAASGKFARAW